MTKPLSPAKPYQYKPVQAEESLQALTMGSTLMPPSARNFWRLQVISLRFYDKVKKPWEVTLLSKTQPAACFLWPRNLNIPGFISSVLTAFPLYGRAVPHPNMQGHILGSVKFWDSKAHMS